MSSRSATRAEVCAAACSDLFRGDGEIFASPMGVIPTLGARLARLTHNPDLLLSDGEALLLGDTPPLGEAPACVEGQITYRQVFDVIAWGRRHVIMGGAQIDRHGNQNLSCIGDFDAPTRQLLGSRGAPGNTVQNRTSYWIPRHSTRVFVDRVDVVSGVGPTLAEQSGPSASRFNDIHRVVSNLAVLDLGGPGRTLRIVSVHPGVSVAEVVAASGCTLEVPDDVPETRLPTGEELGLIRDRLDPDDRRGREVPERTVQ